MENLTTTEAATQIISILRDRNQTVSTAESLTAGMISSSFADISGSSSILAGGVVSYQLSVKEKVLNIPKEVLGVDAVNKETATLMATNVAGLLGTDYSISATGIAEAYDERGELAYCSIYDNVNKIVHNFYFEFKDYNRNEVREQLTNMLLNHFLMIITSSVNEVNEHPHN